jgi:hypothetical protein
MIVSCPVWLLAQSSGPVQEKYLLSITESFVQYYLRIFLHTCLFIWTHCACGCQSITLGVDSSLLPCRFWGQTQACQPDPFCLPRLTPLMATGNSWEQRLEASSCSKVGAAVSLLPCISLASFTVTAKATGTYPAFSFFLPSFILQPILSVSSLYLGSPHAGRFCSSQPCFGHA